MLKPKDTKIVDSDSIQYSEEELQNIKDWMDHSVTENLSIYLKQKIEHAKNSWMQGAYVASDQKSEGDASSGYCLALFTILSFIESGGVSGGIAENNNATK